MLSKTLEKQLALRLRKAGKTYTEILNEVRVSKSTLSLWLRDVGLSKRQQQLFSKRKRNSQKLGGARRRQMRLDETLKIHQQSALDIGTITQRDILMLSVALYWAEGTKQREYRPTVGVEFANSDAQMIRLFLRWLQEFEGIKKEDIVIRLHIHQNSDDKIIAAKKYWLKVLDLEEKNLQSVLLKKHLPKTVRKKIENDYNGLVSVRIKKSTRLNRRIQGFINAIINLH